MTDDLRPLHPSHRWGKRFYLVREAPGSNRYRNEPIPCCAACLVDGFEDQPAAFEPCRRQDNPAGSKRKKATP